MTRCRLCGGTVDKPKFQHDECYAEWRRRADGGLCTMCGDSDVFGGGIWCRECIRKDNSRHTGYPGVS